MLSGYYLGSSSKYPESRLRNNLCAGFNTRVEMELFFFFLKKLLFKETQVSFFLRNLMLTLGWYQLLPASFSSRTDFFSVKLIVHTMSFYFFVLRITLKFFLFSCQNLLFFHLTF